MYADIALALAHIGFAVFPVKGKTPLVPWRDESTRDPAKIGEHAARFPNAGVGIDTGKSQLVVVDQDVKDGIDGIANWGKHTNGAAPTTYTVRTPSGGRHDYYRDPEGKYIPTAGQVAPGVDVRGVGGFVVGPGSPGYGWVGEMPLRPDDIPVLPDGHILAGSNGGRTGRWAKVDRDRLDPRDRACLEALEVLGGHSPYSAGPKEARYIAVTRPGKTSGASASIGWLGPGLVKVFTPNWPPLGAGDVYDVEQLADLAGTDVVDEHEGWEERFWDDRPYLRHVYAAARARGLAPWGLLGASLATVTAAIPPATYLPGIIGAKGSLNMFVGLVGPSGTGKSAAMTAATEAVPTSGDYATWPVGTGEGLAAALVVYNKETRKYEFRHPHRSVLVVADELDALVALAQRTGATLMPQLRTAISGGQLGFGNSAAELQRIVEAHSYRMALCIGIQPVRAGPLVEDHGSGTPQRMLWMPTLDPDIPDIPPAHPQPYKVTNPDHRGTVTIEVCAQAYTEIRAANVARHRGRTDALDGHALLTRLKVATLLGVVEGHYSVTDEDWTLAGLVMRKSDQTRAQVQRALDDQRRSKAHARAYERAEHDARLVELDTKRVVGVLLRKLRKTRDWVTRKDLTRAAGRDHQLVGAALDQLLEAEQIDVRPGPRRGKQYRIREGQ